jgi:hypothetical protein
LSSTLYTAPGIDLLDLEGVLQNFTPKGALESNCIRRRIELVRWFASLITPGDCTVALINNARFEKPDFRGVEKLMLCVWMYLID